MDGALIINHDGNHSPSPLSGWAALAAGRYAVNLQYFFDTQNSDAGDLTDQLAVEYEGPGLARVEVPANAWSRVPAGGEPGLTLVSPVNGSIIVSSNVALTASVATNANTINKVQFYVGDSFWGQTNVPPYSAEFLPVVGPQQRHSRPAFLQHRLHPRFSVEFRHHHQPATGAWLLAGASEHVQSHGAKIDGAPTA